MDLSIVASMYYSESYLMAFYERITSVADKVAHDYEIIFVNDGSPDSSLDVALSLQQKDPRVVVIDLSMNFGHHKAMMTGLAHANGELVFLIDCDLEEQPEWLDRFYKEFRASTADVIYGVQAQRQGGFWQRFSGVIYWWTFNFLSSHKIPSNMLTARLMTRRYVRQLVKHKENELDISGIWQITGFVQLPIVVNKNSKKTSTYTLKRKLILTVRSITGFSNKPLIYIAVLGMFVLILSFLFFLYIMVVYIFVGKPPSGFTSTILSIWFLGGLILFSIGIVAIYLSVIFVETKKRPYTIIKQIYSRTANEK